MNVCFVLSLGWYVLSNTVFSLQREQVPDNYSVMDPEHKLIYRFVRTLFSAAQLTAECAIVTLVRSSISNPQNTYSWSQKFTYNLVKYI